MLAKSVVYYLSPKPVCSFFIDLSSAKRKFADSLNDFKFQCIGDAETDDEICIGKSIGFDLYKQGKPVT